MSIISAYLALTIAITMFMSTICKVKIAMKNKMNKNMFKIFVSLYIGFELESVALIVNIGSTYPNKISMVLTSILK